MRIGLVSLDQAWLDKEANVHRCKSVLEKIAEKKCDLVIFPEMTLTGFAIGEERVSEFEKTSFALKKFAELSKRYNTNIIFGACLLLENITSQKLPMNCLCVSTRAGDSRSVYSKIHPFSFAQEEKFLGAADQIGIFSVGDVNIGCSVCYDLRFPEIFAVMAPSVELAINIANWPSARIEHWFALLRARAIENQLYMCGVNRVGTDGNGRDYIKSSVIFGPSGEKTEPIWASGEVDIFEIDLSSVRSVRATFPTLQDKRYSLYSRLYASVAGVDCD